MASHKYQVMIAGELSYARNKGEYVEIDDSLAQDPLDRGQIELACECKPVFAKKKAVKRTAKK